MTWATHKLSFHSLIYQYQDGGDSPSRIDEWDTEDLVYLVELVQEELQKRSTGSAEGSRGE